MYRKSSASVVVCAAVVLATVVPAARAAIIATYTFPGSDPAGDAVVPSASHATLTAVTRVGLNAESVIHEFASSDCTPSASIDLGDSYVEFTITADPGYRLHLDSLSFHHTRADQNMNRTGPRNGAVRASFESYGPGSGTGSTFAPVTTEGTAAWDFVDYVSASGGSATFRIYGWNAVGNPSSSMQLRLDDIAIHGFVSPSPEPVLLLPLLPFAIALPARRRRL